MSTLAYIQQKNEIEFDNICRKFALEEARNFIIEFNEARELGYHNTKHCFTVARLCYNLFIMEDDTTIDYNQIRRLLLAAMFHDFNHTGNDPDSKNIENAVAGMRHFLADEFELTLSKIESIIRVTEFPFVHKPQNVLERIIRDADLLQIFEPDHINVSLYGLRGELENKLQLDIPIEEFVEKNKEFVNNVVWYTNSGRVMASFLKPVLFASYDSHLKSLKDASISGEGL